MKQMSLDLVLLSNILSKILQLFTAPIKAIQVSSLITSILLVHRFLAVSGIDCLLTWFAKC